MKNCNAFIIAVLGILLVFEGCVHAQPTQESLPGTLYVDSVYKFSFCSPNYVKDNVDSVVVRAAIYSNDVGAGDNPGAMNFIAATVNNTNLTLPEYRKDARSRLNKQVIVTLDTELTVNGHEAILWVYNVTSKTGERVMLQLDLVANGKAISLMASCSKENYARKATSLQSALMSLKLF